MENNIVMNAAQQPFQRAFAQGAATAQAWRSLDGFGGGVRLRAERADRLAGFVVVDALTGAHAGVVTTAGIAAHAAKPAAIAACTGPVAWSPPPC